MSNNKKNVISIRLDDSSFNQLQEVQDLLKKKTTLNASYSDLFSSMINMYYKLLDTMDDDEINNYIKITLLKIINNEIEK